MHAGHTHFVMVDVQQKPMATFKTSGLTTCSEFLIAAVASQSWLGSLCHSGTTLDRPGGPSGFLLLQPQVFGLIRYAFMIHVQNGGKAGVTTAAIVPVHICRLRLPRNQAVSWEGVLCLWRASLDARMDGTGMPSN